MTAPDPGLTDLIAAHLVETVTPDGDCGVLILDCTCGAEVRFTQADLNAAPVDSTAGALHYMLREHVAVEMEQHTNGRIAELDWDELVAAIPDGWELRESTQLEEVSRVRQRDLEASQATTERWRTRAEKAEATIARVEAEAALLERMIRTAPWSRYTEVRRSHLRSLCAALERPGDAG